MTLDQIIQLMQNRDMTKLKGFLDRYILIENEFKGAREYHPELHKIFDKALRKNKIISEPETSDREAYTREVQVARLALAFQQKIVDYAVAFMGIPSYNCTPANATEQNLLDIIEQIEDTSMLCEHFAEIATKTKSERHCAELWYTTDITDNYWGALQIEGDVQL